MFMRSKILPSPRIFTRVAAVRLFVSLLCLLWMVSGSVAWAGQTDYTFDNPSSGNDIVVNGDVVTRNGETVTPSTTTTYNSYDLYTIYGGRDSSGAGASNNRVTVNGNSDSNYYIWGGYSSSGDADNNAITFSGGATSQLHGGYAIGGNANGNSITVNGVLGANNNSSISIFGGYAYPYANATSTKTNKTVTANNNTVTINGAEISESSYVHIVGGISLSGDANGNVVDIQNSKIGSSYSSIVGGSAMSTSANAASGNANNNTITVNSSEAAFSTVIGGSAINYNKQATNINANDNTVNFESGTAMGVIGGHSLSVNSDTNSVTYENAGLASGNTVNIKGGTITSVSGASSYGTASNNTVNISGGSITNVSGSSGGTVTGNVININGGQINGVVVGGYGSNLATSTATVKDNVVNIYNADSLSNASLYGARFTDDASLNSAYTNAANAATAADGSIDIDKYNAAINSVDVSQHITTGNHSGNTLNIYTKDLTAKSIANFDIVNFNLPQSIKNNDTVLTLSGGAALDGTTVNATVPGDSELTNGSKVTLINAQSITDTGATYNGGKLTKGVSEAYEFTIKKADDKNVVLQVGTEQVEPDPISAPTPDPVATKNTVIINNSDYSINGTTTAYDGKSDYVSGETTNTERSGIFGGRGSDVEGAGNNITINGGDIATVAGADNISGTATQNTVTVNGGTVGAVYGAENSTEATYNTVTVNSGTIGTVTGGSSSTTSAYNTVNIKGGTVTGPVTGGACEVAENNVVNIEGGTLSGYVYGGQGTVRSDNNTINIYNSPDISAATLVGGDTSNGATASGNTLNIYTKDLTAQNIVNFDNVNFYLPTTTQNGDTALTLIGGAATDLSGSAIKAGVQGDSSLQNGDVVTLIKNDSGITTDAATSYGTLSVGVSSAYDLAVAKSGDNAITATIVNTSPSIEDSKYEEVRQIIGGTPVAVPSIVANHIAGTINWLPPDDAPGFDMGVSGISGTTTDGSNKGGTSGESEDSDPGELESGRHAGLTGYNIFANVGVSSMRTKTGDGSYMDSVNRGFDMGAARAFNTGNGTLHFAPIFDYGTGSFDSYLNSGIHGQGSTRFYMGGVIARHTLKNGFYYEGSLRYGKATMDFVSNDPALQWQGKPNSYETSAPCWAGHINVGYRYKPDPYNAVDFYAMYFRTHQGSMEAKLTSGEDYRFDAVTNHKFRIGARITRYINDHSRFYSGLAYEYVNDGAARGTWLQNGKTSEQMGSKGGSGILELGWQYKPTKTNPWMVDTALVGYVGHQRGLTFQTKVKFEF